MLKVKSISILIISSILFVSCNSTSSDDNYDDVVRIEVGEELSKTIEWRVSDDLCASHPTAGEESYLDEIGISDWVEYDIDRDNEAIDFSGLTNQPGEYSVIYDNVYYWEDPANGTCNERREQVNIKVIVGEEG